MRLIMRLAVALLLLGNVHYANAATVLFDNFGPGIPSAGGNELGDAAGGYDQGNFFIPTIGASALVAEVAIALNPLPPGNQITALLYSDDSGLPGATSLGAVTLTGQAVAGAGSVLSFAFDPSVSVGPSLKYWLVLTGGGGTAFTWLDAGGVATSEPFRQNGGPWVANLGTPGAFRITGNASPVPLPAAAWLLLSGLGGLGLVTRKRRA